MHAPVMWGKAPISNGAVTLVANLPSPAGTASVPGGGGASANVCATHANDMAKANPKDTGMMHGMLALHIGMWMRFLDALDVEKSLVKDAEGIVVSIVYHPLDQDHVDAAIANGEQRIYLRHLPLGIWLRMDKYNKSPFTDDDLGAGASQLVFVEPKTSDPFVFRNHKVRRTGFPLSHARVVTTTACQGRTMRAGVLIDCGRHESGNTVKEDADWWLDIYVMLSKATRLADLLLIRAPPVSFLLQGPPEDVRKRLQEFTDRAGNCRKTARKVVRELGFDENFYIDPRSYTAIVLKV